MSDLIDRQAAIDAIKELCEYYTPTKSVKHPHMDFVIEQLEELPSAQPERKKGKWIENNGDVEEPFYHCSVCEWDAYTMWDYCPKCGADMRDENE